ncbi:MAG: hypothetical protein HFJ50_02025 [Clostridia bacterium]|jgi:hypothetical protein|nr:hypothetical protein [Clostridia bacterium]
MEEIIKLLLVIGLVFLCIWGANGCYEIMEGNDKKMKKYKTKLGRIINFIKNENKFEFGDMVRILPLNKDLGTENFYTKYIGLLGIVTSISYDKKDCVFGVKFEDGNRIDFRASELEKIQPENPLRYKKLNIEY